LSLPPPFPRINAVHGRAGSTGYGTGGAAAIRAASNASPSDVQSVIGG
jgi:hypothetical protein